MEETGNAAHDTRPTERTQPAPGTYRYHSVWLVLAVVITAAALLGWHAMQRQLEFEAQQLQLVKTVVRSAAREINLQLRELQRSVQLFADGDAGQIRRLAANPGDREARDRLVQKVRARFPEAIAIAITDDQGRTLADSLENPGSTANRDDPHTFSTIGKAPAIAIRSALHGDHFHLIVAVPLEPGKGGSFLVHFRPRGIDRLLSTNHLLEHQVILLDKSDNGFTKITVNGSRNRKSLLTDAERSRIDYAVPVAGTSWELVALSEPGHKQQLRIEQTQDAAWAIAIVLSIGFMAVWGLWRSQKQVALQSNIVASQAREIQRSEDRLHRLQETTSAAELDFDGKMQALLRLGLREFGLDIGILSQVEGDRYEVLHVVSPDNAVAKHSVFPLGDTYCRRTLQAGRAVAVEHAAQSEWRDHPCYRTFRLEAYIAAPVQVNGKTFGTLNFSSPKPLATRFTSRDLEFLQLMARWAGMELERNRAEDRLRDSEGRVHAILNTVIDGIITIDAHGIVQTFNPAAERIFGFTPPEIIGKNVSLLMPEPYRHAHDTYMARYLESGQAKVIGIGREVSGQRKDGSLFPMELAVNELRRGDQRLFTGIVRDITERKRAQQQLDRFKTTLDRTLDCVFMFEPDSLKFFYVNQGAMDQVEYSYDELMNMTSVDIKPEYDEARFRAILAPLIEGRQQATTFEAIHQSKSGREIPVEISLQYIDPPGEPSRFVSIVRDITERKQVERLKNEFISTVSHELRTPLTSIRGSLGLLHGGMAGELPEQAAALIEIAHRNSERLLLLINDILDLSKIESGKLAFRFETVALMPFLEQALAANLGYAEQHDVHIELTSRLDDSWIYVDGDRLMQVMNNLLSNAAKFAPAHSGIEVAATRRDNNVRISVTDHGSGIPAEFRDRIFDKFSQADSSDTRQAGGTGLGLNITKAIVERQGGQIGFETETGVGTIFYFDLPVSFKTPDQKQSESADTLATARKRVLVCEDDPDIAALLRMILKGAGFGVDVAHNAAAAKQLLSRHEYAAMTLDMMLPDQDGISLFRELRAQEATRALPIVVVSAVTDNARQALNGSALNVVDWLAKPIDKARLLAAVKHALGPQPNGLPRILHVEDDPDVSGVVRLLLKGQAEVVPAATLGEAQHRLQQGRFDIVLLDLGLADGSGLELLDVIHQHSPPPKVVIFSATEVDAEVAQGVSAALVKSRTDNRELLDMLLSVIARKK